MSHLYVVQIGTTVKVGISTGPRVTVSSVDCEHIALRRGQVAPA